LFRGFDGRANGTIVKDVLQRVEVCVLVHIVRRAEIMVIGGVPVGSVGVQAAVFATGGPHDVGGVAQLNVRQVELQHNRGNLGVRGGIEGRNGILGNRQLRIRDLWQLTAGRDAENLVLGIVAHLGRDAGTNDNFRS